MARLKTLAVSTRDMFNIDPRAIQIEGGFNVRDFSLAENIEHVARLKESIRLGGVKTPLTVRLVNDVVYLVDGESRLRAVDELLAEGVEILSVPCQTTDRGENDAERAISMLDRNEGKQFNMQEQGILYKRMLGYGWNMAQIAKRAGRSATHVGNCITLLEAPSLIQQYMREGLVAPSTVAKLMSKGGGEQVAEAITNAVSTAKAEGRKRATNTQIAVPVTTAELAAEMGVQPQSEPAVLHLGLDTEAIDYLVAVLKYIAAGHAEKPEAAAREALIQVDLWKEPNTQMVVTNGLAAPE